MLLRLLVALTWVASAQADFTSWTDRERQLGSAAFPDPMIDRYAVQPSAEFSQEVEKILKDAVDVVRLKPGAWFASAVPNRQITTAEIERVLKSAPGIPVRICKNGAECVPCDRQPACISAKAVGNETGAMIFVRQCALDAQGCKGSSTSFHLRPFLERSLALFAHFKIVGTTSRTQAEQNSKKAAAVLQEISSSVNGLLSRCPGPYQRSDMSFLSSGDHLSAASGFAAECGTSYLKALAKSHPGCGSADLAKIEVLRCDGYCQAMLCMKGGKAPQIRTVGGAQVLFLRPDSCEGAKPSAEKDFVSQSGQVAEICASKVSR